MIRTTAIEPEHPRCPPAKVFRTCEKHRVRLQPGDCHVCGGDGWIDALDWQWANEYGEQRCYSCHGTGRGDDECEWCEEDALLERPVGAGMNLGITDHARARLKERYGLVADSALIRELAFGIRSGIGARQIESQSGGREPWSVHVSRLSVTIYEEETRGGMKNGEAKMFNAAFADEK
jgi:hypothetical protein